MAKAKYYYAIVSRENGNPIVISGQLPVYWKKEVADDVMSNFGEYHNWCIVRLSIADIESVILKSKILK